MKVEETYINKDKGYRFGESGLYEPYTENIAELFRSFQKEYGRCVSKVYVDEDNKTKQVGWVFEKRMKYDDTDEEYTREVWVTIHKKEPTRTVEYHYEEIE